MQLVKGQCLWPAGLTWSHILVTPQDLFIYFFTILCALWCPILPSGRCREGIIWQGSLSKPCGQDQRAFAFKGTRYHGNCSPYLISRNAGWHVCRGGEGNSELWVWGSSAKLPKKDEEAGRKQGWPLTVIKWWILGYLPGICTCIISVSLTMAQLVWMESSNSWPHTWKEFCLPASTAVIPRDIANLPPRFLSDEFSVLLYFQ